MNFRKCAWCSHRIELSTARQRGREVLKNKKKGILTDLTVVSSCQSPSMRPVIVAALLLSPRLSDLSPHAARVPQPSRGQEGAQGLPYCVERDNEKVQLLETIRKEKRVKDEKAPARITETARKWSGMGRGSEIWVTTSSLGRLHSTVRTSV